MISPETEEKKEKEGEETAKSPSQNNYFSRLVSLNKAEWHLALLGSLAAIIQGCTFPLFSVLLSSIIRIFYYSDLKRMERKANFWALMFVLLGFASFLSLTVQFWMFSSVGSALVRRIRALTFQKVLSQEIAWFDKPENSRFAPLHSLIFPPISFVCSLLYLRNCHFMTCFS